MKGSVKMVLSGVEIKIEGMPIKIGELTYEGSCEHSWWDMFILRSMFKAFPGWFAKLYKATSELQDDLSK